VSIRAEVYVSSVHGPGYRVSEDELLGLEVHAAASNPPNIMEKHFSWVLYLDGIRWPSLEFRNLHPRHAFDS
jgi:hypothetical protein